MNDNFCQNQTTFSCLIAQSTLESQRSAFGYHDSKMACGIKIWLWSWFRQVVDHNIQVLCVETLQMSLPIFFVELMEDIIEGTLICQGPIWTRSIPQDLTRLTNKSHMKLFCFFDIVLHKEPFLLCYWFSLRKWQMLNAHARLQTNHICQVRKRKERFWWN